MVFVLQTITGWWEQYRLAYSSPFQLNLQRTDLNTEFHLRRSNMLRSLPLLVFSIQRGTHLDSTVLVRAEVVMTDM